MKPNHLRQLHNLSMTSDEKERMRHMLSLYTHESLKKHTSLVSPTFSFRFSRALVGVLTICVIVLCSGTATVYAAEKSLPGETLYAVKIHITEPIRASLAVSTEAKANWEATKVERRIAEEQMLADRGILTQETQTTLEIQIADSVKRSDELTTQLETQEQHEQARTIRTRITSALSQNAQRSLALITYTNTPPQEENDSDRDHETEDTNETKQEDETDEDRATTRSYDQTTYSTRTTASTPTSTDTIRVMPVDTDIEMTESNTTDEQTERTDTSTERTSPTSEQQRTHDDIHLLAMDRIRYVTDYVLAHQTDMSTEDYTTALLTLRTLSSVYQQSHILYVNNAYREAYIYDIQLLDRITAFFEVLSDYINAYDNTTRQELIIDTPTRTTTTSTIDTTPDTRTIQTTIEHTTTNTTDTNTPTDTKTDTTQTTDTRTNTTIDTTQTNTRTIDTTNTTDTSTNTRTDTTQTTNTRTTTTTTTTR